MINIKKELAVFAFVLASVLATEHTAKADTGNLTSLMTDAAVCVALPPADGAPIFPSWMYDLTMWAIYTDYWFAPNPFA